MVGHTGRLDASILAVEAVDLQLGRLIRTIGALDGALIVTADHGNCDEMYELGKDGNPKLDAEGRPSPRTSHSLNPVPFYVHAPNARGLRLNTRVEAPTLANVAATALYLMGYAAPTGYAPSLVES
jgi:2,3-bisphosphoglycerate-independent phosphoglycerate mutase